MHNGFVKVAAGSPRIAVADVKANADAVRAMIRRAHDEGVNLLVLPELCLTGYTCGDLFYSEILLDAAKEALSGIAAYTDGLYPVVVLGLPLRVNGKLYNCAAVVHDGSVLGVVPKTYLPNASEFYEQRQFTSGDCPARPDWLELDGDDEIPFGSSLLFECCELPEFRFGVELCEDVWTPDPPSRMLCQRGAAIIANASASDEVIGKKEYRRMLIQSTSARLVCGYVYANADCGESTQDMVFSQHNIICENGAMLAENPPFGQDDLIATEIDVYRLMAERHKLPSYVSNDADADALTVSFSQPLRETALTRRFARTPFVPASDELIAERAEEILRIQSYGLKKRVEHTHVKTIVVGVSGGLDSCLALLVMVRTMDLLKRDRKDIVAISMPCFGTTKRTRSNAELLCEQLGVTFREIDITAAVRQHFRDIGHDESVRDVTYENGQARERTKVLMNVANKLGGLVVGTGDLSELALGWATYNGDHMSMYGVNASIPKTLVRYIVRYEASHSDKALADVLFDILDTPVSPELLPADESGEIQQKTEDLVGPYELHDFFLYYMLRFGFRPAKIFRIARQTFDGVYSDEVILKWLRTFFRRFFMQQFKRSCLPDGPKVGSATLSPRGDWRMPSDACATLWLEEIDAIRL